MKKNTFQAIIGATIIVALLAFFYLGDKTESEKDGDKEVIEVKGQVIGIQDEDIMSSGPSSIGYQKLNVVILEGDNKGQTIIANNQLNGQVDYDNIYKTGDTLILGLYLEDNTLKGAVTVDLYRQPWLLGLFATFVVALLIYAGFIGFKALISFIFSLTILWEVLVKGLLEGKDPLLLTVFTVMLLTAIIVFLVAGFTPKGLSAFLGTVSGLMVTLVLTLFFGKNIGLYGLTQPYVTQLIFSGYYTLNLQQIFYSAIILGASGAAMDIAMDIAASMDELKKKRPDLATGELIQSGFNIGRHVIGTMATTLLLAYSGGYLTLLMLFQVKDASFLRMINMKIVASELMRTLIGSMGLVLVAPITAIITGIILSKITVDENVNESVDLSMMKE